MFSTFLCRVGLFAERLQSSFQVDAKKHNIYAAIKKEERRFGIRDSLPKQSSSYPVRSNTRITSSPPEIGTNPKKYLNCDLLYMQFQSAARQLTGSNIVMCSPDLLFSY